MRIGMIGTGSMARKMTETMLAMKEVECYAVASRDAQRAEQFRKEFGLEKAYGSYEELAMDPQVELIYIASPHSHHYEHAKLCLSHKKPLLIEKAFTVNAAQARELFSIAEKTGTFFTEAVWVRYMPMRKKMDEILQSGVLGEISSLTANFGHPLQSIQRLCDPALAGGALLDLGVYPINFAFMVFGNQVTSVSSSVVMSETGVDARNSITLLFENGKMAVLHSNMTAKTDQTGVVFGSKGYMVVENINNISGIRVFDQNGCETAYYERPEQISGYEYEVEASVRAMRDGKTECQEMPHEDTLRIMELMDQLRSDWNLVFPCE